MQNTQQTSSFWMYVFFIIFLGVLGLVGYGAYSLLSNPAHYAEEIWSAQRSKGLATETQPIDNSDVVIDEKPTPDETPVEQPKPVTDTTTLSGKIDGLITRNVVLKQGNKGADVGVMQEFMNQYYKRKDKIDNDFGAGLTALVKKFQGSQKLPTTGQIGPRTLEAMKKLAK
jgi:hypothetical protein